MLTIKNLSKSFGHKHVLRNLSLTVPKGASVVIIGGSGTGKSVLLKNILGLMAPDAGQIIFDGKDITHAKGRARTEIMQKTGMLFQGAALFDSLRIWENVAFGLMQGFGVAKKEARTIAIEKLRQVGLAADVADAYPAEISGGMQKRVGLARAIAAKPSMLFFDEPTTGLDPIMANVINDLIVQCVRDLGATALSITHDMNSVRRIADYVALLYKGEILWYGGIRELERCDNAYVLQFINGLSQGPISVDV